MRRLRFAEPARLLRRLSQGYAPRRPSACTFNGTSDFISTAMLPVSAYPLTMVAWAMPSSAVSTTMHIMGLYDTASTIDRISLSFNATTRTLRMAVAAVGASTASDTANAATADAWNHCAAWFASATSRGVILNNGAEVTNATSRVFDAEINSFAFGRQDNSAAASWFNGQIAHPAVWNVALTAAEIAKLSLGADPRTVQPQALVFYAPRLFPDPRNIKTGAALTLTGGAASSLLPSVRVR